tara:strand:- start:42 stop:935 length:894 start_codon:yes stop_codon:yes gene_type:complete
MAKNNWSSDAFKKAQNLFSPGYNQADTFEAVTTLSKDDANALARSMKLDSGVTGYGNTPFNDNQASMNSYFPSMNQDYQAETIPLDLNNEPNISQEAPFRDRLEEQYFPEDPDYMSIDNLVNLGSKLNPVQSAEAGILDDGADFLKRKYNKLTGVQEEYIQQTQNHLASKGLSKEAVAGIMGNISVETDDSFDFTQKQKNDGNGYGLFQLDFLRPHYNDWLKENSLEDQATTQIDFMYDTIYGDSQDLIGKGNAKKLRDSFKSGDYKKITKDFMKIWEKPGIPHAVKRLKEAEKYIK